MTVTAAPPRSIPFFRYSHLLEQQREEILEAVTAVMERGAFILQEELEQFERDLATYTGVEHAIGVANGTDSLIIALHASGIGAGDDVIVPSHTYVASVAAIHFAGANPVLVDCGADHLVDPASIEAAISPRTRALMPVHLNGRTCNMDRIMSIARRHGLVVIEDTAQALGSRFRGSMAGSFGVAGSFSFYPAKVLGCFGDGGALITRDSAVAQRIRLLRDHGRDEKGEVRTWGLNSRLDNLQAAILSVKMRRFGKEIARRREIAYLYEGALSEIGEMVLPPGPDSDPDHFDVYQNYEVEAESREQLRGHLERDGIRTIIQWGGKAVHQFAGLGFPHLDLPATDELFRRCFLLPMNTSLTDDEISYTCDSIRRFYGIAS